MKVTASPLPEVLIIEPNVLGDDRGFFMETYNAARFREHGIDAAFVQDNHSRSRRGVVRGLHYQEPQPQGKLVRCVNGALWDVAVDIRVGSPRFGQWFGLELSESNRTMLWIPPGFAHGFCALTDSADLVYKCTELWNAAADRSLAWNDPDIAISWPVSGEPVISPKDLTAPRLRDASVLPAYRA